MSTIKAPPESIVDDLLATRKPSVTEGTNAPADEDDKGTALRNKSNSFASFAASGVDFGTWDEARTVRGRDRRDEQIQAQGPVEDGGTPVYRRLSRKQSKVRRPLSFLACGSRD